MLQALARQAHRNNSAPGAPASGDHSPPRSGSLVGSRSPPLRSDRSPSAMQDPCHRADGGANTTAIDGSTSRAGGAAGIELHSALCGSGPRRGTREDDSPEISGSYSDCTVHSAPCTVHSAGRGAEVDLTRRATATTRRPDGLCARRSSAPKLSPTLREPARTKRVRLSRPTGLHSVLERTRPRSGAGRPARAAVESPATAVTACRRATGPRGRRLNSSMRRSSEGEMHRTAAFPWVAFEPGPGRAVESHWRGGASRPPRLHPDSSSVRRPRSDDKRERRWR
jgi:hypothetical protein